MITDQWICLLAGPESMFMYDPSMFGTPLTLLQIPQQAIEEVQNKCQKDDIMLAHYTQDCKTFADLKTLVSATSYVCARQAMVDVGYICKKCHMVYPGRDACVSHQVSMCYQGKTPAELTKTILKLEQIQFQCSACREKFSAVQEYQVHCRTESHKQKAAKLLANKAPAPTSTKAPSRNEPPQTSDSKESTADASVSTFATATNISFSSSNVNQTDCDQDITQHKE